MRNHILHLFTPHHTNDYRAVVLKPQGLSIITTIFLICQLWINIAAYRSTLPGGMVLGYASNITAAQTIELTNKKRAETGLSPLAENPQLSEAARAKAQHMFANDYWAHVAPDGTTPWSFIRSAGYSYVVAGENLARDFDDTGSMMNAWMSSPTHKENIVHQKYTQIGVGVVNGILGGVETTLVVQMFGQPTGNAQMAKKAEIAPVAAQTSQTEEANEPEANLGVIEPSIIPSQEPTIIAAPEPTVQINQIASLDEDSDQSLGLQYREAEATHDAIISPKVITKAVTLAILILLAATIMYDYYYIHLNKIPRRVGKNWAHLSILLFTLTYVLLTAEGKVL